MVYNLKGGINTLMKKSLMMAIGFMLPAIIMVSACSKSNNQTDGGSNDAEGSTPAPTVTQKELETPVAVKLSAGASYLSDADLNLLIIEPLKKKYPEAQMKLRATKDPRTS